MIIRRAWAMPTRDTFSCLPITQFVERWAQGVTADPFARNSKLATYRNDLDPETDAESHMDAVEFVASLADKGVVADCVLLDPPYSPRQVKECYNGFGKSMGKDDTLRGKYLKRLRDAVEMVVPLGGVVLSFGWNSTGMGLPRGFQTQEILLVCHGSDHNDTICVAERRVAAQMPLFGVRRARRSDSDARG